MLIGIFGTFGSGKTLLMAILGYIVAKNPNYQVYANFEIKHPKVKTIEPEDFLDINPKNKKAMVLIDEAYAWLDSRMSMAKVNRFLSYVVLQSRKRNMDIFYTAQLSGSVDLRLRELTDIFIICQKLPTENGEQCFVYNVYEWKTLNKLSEHHFIIRWNQAEKYFNRFDTREIISPVTELMMKQFKPKKKMKNND